MLFRSVRPSHHSKSRSRQYLRFCVMAKRQSPVFWQVRPASGVSLMIIVPLRMNSFLSIRAMRPSTETWPWPLTACCSPFRINVLFAHRNSIGPRSLLVQLIHCSVIPLLPRSCSSAGRLSTSVGGGNGVVAAAPTASTARISEAATRNN